MKQTKRPVSLEDLLRLKRAEQPAPEFWGEFDRQLRAKQLAALVRKRPWWEGLGQRALGLARFHVAVGATAALAITFVSLRKDGPAPQAPAMATDDGAVAAVAPVAVPSARISTVDTRNSGGIVSTGSATAPAAYVPMMETMPAADGPVYAGAASAEVDDFSAFESPGTTTVEAPEPTPSARFIAANYAAAQDSMGAGLMADVQGFDVREMPVRVAKIEPLQQMTPPGEARRSTRFLTAMVSNSPSEFPARTTERLANRISPEELYDQVRRIGTRHGGFNVKF